MKESISDELYVARAKNIIAGDYALESIGEENEYFLVNPIIAKPLIGKEFIVGGVEAISKVKLFDVIYWYKGSSGREIDIYGNKIGGVHWSVSFLKKAEDVLQREVIYDYFKTSKEEMIYRINEMRNRYDEISRLDDMKKVFTRL